MNRTVNKKAILIMLGSIAGAGLLYFGGFLLAGYRMVHDFNRYRCFYLRCKIRHEI